MTPSKSPSPSEVIAALRAMSLNPYTPGEIEPWTRHAGDAIAALVVERDEARREIARLQKLGADITILVGAETDTITTRGGILTPKRLTLCTSVNIAIHTKITPEYAKVIASDPDAYLDIAQRCAHELRTAIKKKNGTSLLDIATFTPWRGR